MTKEAFLEKLRKKLNILDSNEVDDIIAEYGGYIDEKVKKGKTEEEAIKEFGDFNELVKEILSAYKISEDYEKKQDWFSETFEKIGNALETIVKRLSKQSASEIAKFFVEIIIIVLLISLFRIPVSMLVNLGKDIFALLIHPFDVIFTAIWRFVLELTYLALAIIFFVKIFKERYLNDAEVDQETKPLEKKKKLVKKVEEKKEDIKEEKIVEPKQKNGLIGTAANVVVWIFKIFLAFCLFPLGFCLLGLMIACGFGIGLLCYGIPYFGVVLCIFAVLSFFILLFEVIFNFIVSKKNNATKVFISLIVNFVLLSAGITLTAAEVADSKFIDAAPEGYKMETITKELAVEDLITPEYAAFYWNIEFEEDETKTDDIRVDITYYPGFTEYNEEMTSFIPSLKRGREYRLSEILDIVKKDLKDRTLYNYSLLFVPQIKVTTSKENIRDIKNQLWETHKNYRGYWYDDMLDELHDAKEEAEYWKDRYNKRYSQEGV